MEPRPGLELGPVDYKSKAVVFRAPLKSYRSNGVPWSWFPFIRYELHRASCE